MPNGRGRGFDRREEVPVPRAQPVTPEGDGQARGRVRTVRAQPSIRRFVSRAVHSTPRSGKSAGGGQTGPPAPTMPSPVSTRPREVDEGLRGGP